MITTETVKEWLARYQNDLPGFVRDVWGVTPYPWQAEVAGWLSKDKTRRIAIPAGRGVGKTALLAWSSLWFLLTRYPCKVIQTAPSKATLEDGLFAETRMWAERLPPALRSLLDIVSDRITLAADPASAFLSVRTARADVPDAMQGIHAPFVLLIVDEGSGVPDTVYEAAQGSMAGSNRFMVVAGNPLYASGYFYHAITTNAHTVWRVRRVPSTEVPSTSQEFRDEIAAIYGEESNVYRVHILGLPPTSDEDTIIPLHLVQAAINRDVSVTANQPIIWGLDVAGLGKNESALAIRQGNTLLEPVKRYSGLEEMQLVGRVMAEYEALREDRRPAEICVDGIGLGAGVVSRLKELGLPAVSINVSEHRSDDPAYFNLKAELWWRARAWFAALDVKIPSDNELIKGLTIPKIDYHSTGKLMVESKDSIRRRLKHMTPRLDAADAFVLTFANRATTALYGRRKGFKRLPIQVRVPIV
jgi:phage terminase large subunit